MHKNKFSDEQIQNEHIIIILPFQIRRTVKIYPKNFSQLIVIYYLDDDIQ